MKDQDINNLLDRILTEKTYVHDYNVTTEKLLNEDVTYKLTISVLREFDGALKLVNGEK